MFPKPRSRLKSPNPDLLEPQVLDSQPACSGRLPPLEAPLGNIEVRGLTYPLTEPSSSGPFCDPFSWQTAPPCDTRGCGGRHFHVVLMAAAHDETPYTLSPKPQTLNPKLQAQNPKPLNP